MATLKNNHVVIEGPNFYALRDAFRQMPPNIAARVIGAGLRRASAPMLSALKEVTPRGPTGNLRRSIKTIVKRYPKNGAAVAVVGYQKAGTGGSKSAGGGSVQKGPDRAFHQFWMEFGTKDRYTKKPGARGGYIASSYNRLGPFKIQSSENGSVYTKPGYPRAFFKKSMSPVWLRAMTARHPVKTAFERSRGKVESMLYGEMLKAIESGMKIVEYNARRKAEMKDSGRYL